MMSFSSGLATPVTVRFVSKRHQVFRVCTLCPVARQPSSPTVNVSRHTDQILLFLTCTVPTQRWGFNCSFAEIFEHAGRPAPSLPDALHQPTPRALTCRVLGMRRHAAAQLCTGFTGRSSCAILAGQWLAQQLPQLEAAAKVRPGFKFSS